MSYSKFLMEVTRREGLSWEANLAAHASTIWFLMFNSLCIIYKPAGPPCEVKVEPFHYKIISKQAIFMFPTNLPPGITCLEALLEL